MVNEDLLRTLFVKKSLKNTENGFQMQMQNSISDATIIEPIKVEISGEGVDKEKYKDFIIDLNGEKVENKTISESNPAKFSVKALATLIFNRDSPLPEGKYKIRFTKLLTEEYGDIPFTMKERIRD
ncbi:MAG: hypothetical protein EAX86_03780 [Candidatus Heimdallarchaeota archaeon]|nr:hypothetical protein [Candidatus Heimdallarchaeota archaeon]